MKRLFNLLLISIIIIFLVSCSTGRSAYNRGDYYTATMQAVKRLRSSPDNEKAIDMVKKSYPMAIAYYRQQIDGIAASNAVDKFLRISNHYKTLNTLADEISRSPAALEAVKPVVYFHDQLKKAEQMAIDEQFNNAITLLGSRNIYDARKAYEKLVWVKKTQPNQRGIDEQLAIAKDLATLKVVVEQLPDQNANYEVNTREFYMQVYNYLVKNTPHDFIRFYQPQLAQELNITPHQVVSVQVKRFNIGAIIEREQNRTYISDSLVVGSYTANDGNNYDVKGIVKADVVAYYRELTAKGSLQVVIEEFQGEVLNTQTFANDFIWKNNWATFNGDERALPDEINNMTRSKLKNPPQPQEVFILVTEPLVNPVASFIRTQYKKY
ncbi:MAG: hypothetical protein PF436_08645 [Prolixibacteraceae bacterium]|jgi:hypothetical protein|nr:hypothetical protein [Prolixibacteraceae bacterium]